MAICNYSITIATDIPNSVFDLFEAADRKFSTISKYL